MFEAASVRVPSPVFSMPPGPLILALMTVETVGSVGWAMLKMCWPVARTNWPLMVDSWAAEPVERSLSSVKVPPLVSISPPVTEIELTSSSFPLRSSFEPSLTVMAADDESWPGAKSNTFAALVPSPTTRSPPTAGPDDLARTRLPELTTVDPV